jgi:hypothetical protein
METEGSLRNSQESVTCPYPVPYQSSPCPLPPPQTTKPIEWITWELLLYPLVTQSQLVSRSKSSGMFCRVDW